MLKLNTKDIFYISLSLVVLNIILLFITAYRIDKVMIDINRRIKETDNLIQQTKQQLNQTQDNINQVNKRLIKLENQVDYLDDKVSKLQVKLGNKKLSNKVKTFIRRVNPSLSETQVSFLSNSFIKASKTYQIPLTILLAVAWQESHFNPYAHSSVGCIGIMQINPNVWLNRINLPEELLWHSDINIMVGAYILKYYYEKTRNWKETIYRYYGISREGWKYQRKILRRMKLVERFLKGGKDGIRV